MKYIKGLVLVPAIGLLSGAFLNAKQVDVQTAHTVATNFIAQKQKSNDVDVVLKDKILLKEQGTGLNVAYYIFDVNNNNGFVLVSGDDVVKPILAYSIDKQFEIGTTQSPETKYWTNVYYQQINYITTNNIKAEKDVTAQWSFLANSNNGTANKPNNFVAPLLTTTWDQGRYYNINTPGTGNGKTPVGCVATAMAQIMKYWDAPTTGVGSYDYTHQTYGNLSADFGATTYSWASMPNSLSQSSPMGYKQAVSLLGYHCAISVKMNFAPGGSGAYVLAWNNNTPCAENAFKNYFNYRNSIEGVYRDDYTDAQWIDLLKSELDLSRPILYAGYGSAGGHAFVFDGYDDNNLFHINWGWGGMSNGYFTVDNLAPSALGIGGGGGNFNTDQQALIKIEPLLPGQVNDTLGLAMNSAINMAATTIEEGDGFTVEASIKNIGQLDFLAGSLQAQIYNSADSTPKIYFNRQTNQSLANGNNETYTFTTNGIASLSPGNYFIRIQHTDINNTWKSVADDNSHLNFLPITVVERGTSTKDLALANAITLYPNPANDKINIDTKSFSGAINAIKLFDLQGRLVNALQGKQQAISTSNLSEGVYYLQIVTTDGVLNKKFVVKH